MKNKSMITVLALVWCAPFVHAHDGHDHDAPKQIQAPKGGVVKSLEETNVEVVSKGKDIKIYLYDKRMKPQNISGYKVSASTMLPRSKKSEALVLTNGETYFEGSYDARGSHRYTLMLVVTDPKTGHADKLSFTIEPRK